MTTPHSLSHGDSSFNPDNSQTVTENGHASVQTNYLDIFSPHIQKQKISGEELTGCCPIHLEQNPSWSGNLVSGLWMCHGCGAKGNAQQFIAAVHSHSTFTPAVSQKQASEKKKKGKTIPFGKIVATYSYTDEQGNVLYQSVKNETGDPDKPKTFWFRRPGESGKWITGLGPARRVPYHLPEIIPAQVVHIVEGEKDVETLRDLGFVATTSPSGGNTKWRKDYTPFFRDKDVVIIPDNDTTGEKYAQEVYAALVSVVRSVKIIRLPGLPPIRESHGEDVTDWLQQGHTKEELEQVISETTPLFTKEVPVDDDVQTRGSLTKHGLVPHLAEVIANLGVSFAQDKGRSLYIYTQGAGVYQEDAELFIHREVIKHLRKERSENLWTSHLQNEVATYIRTQAPLLWDFPPLDEVCLKNGIYNLTTGNLRPHSPAWLSPVQIPVIFDPSATCPNIERFIKQILHTDTEPIFYEYAGNLITFDRSDPKSLLFLGESGMGKSTALTLYRNFVGHKNAAAHSLQSLTNDKFAASDLYGKLANICADLPSRYVQDTGIYKQITGGDSITVQRKFGHPFTFTPHCRFIFSANRPPRSSDDSDAFYDRWTVIPLSKKFRDTSDEIPRTTLDALLSTPEELSGLLNIALKAIVWTRQQGGFSKTTSSREALTKFRNQTDPFAIWLQQNVTKSLGSYVTKTELCQAYNRYREQEKQSFVTEEQMGAMVKKHWPDINEGQKRIGSGRPRVFYDIALIPNR